MNRPRNISQTVWAKAVPCESEENPTEPVAPPKLRVMIFPRESRVIRRVASLLANSINIREDVIQFLHSRG
jgi:hypothetical protein